MKKLIFVAILSIIIFGSCKKSENENPQPKAAVQNPPHVVSDTIYTIEYQMNGFHDARFTNITTSIDTPIIASKYVSFNFYDVSDTVEICAFADKSHPSLQYSYDIPLHRGDQVQFWGWTNIGACCETATYYDFVINVNKYLIIDGVKSKVATVSKTGPVYNPYRHQAIYIFNI